MHLTTEVKVYEAKLIELQEEADEPTFITGDFNTPLCKMEKCSRQKISRDIVDSTTPGIKRVSLKYTNYCMQ